MEVSRFLILIALLNVLLKVHWYGLLLYLIYLVAKFPK